MKKILLIVGLCIVLLMSSFVSAVKPLYYWSFDTDATGDIGGVDGVLYGSPTHTSTDCGHSSCYDLDGTSDWINVSNGGQLLADIAGNFTVCMYFNQDTVDGYLFSEGGWDANDPFMMRLDTDMRFIQTDSVSAYIIDDDFGIAKAESSLWHMCYVFDAGNNRTIYYNGVLDESIAYAGINVKTLAGRHTIIGGDSLAGSDKFDGTIDEVVIYDIALSSTEVATLYANDGVPETDSSSLNLLLSNTTDTGIYKTDFNNGEDFYIYANYTLNDIAVNDTVGYCNFTAIDILYYKPVTDDSFTLCSTCDYSYYSEILDMHETTNAVSDIVFFEACNQETVKKDIVVNLKCTAGTATTTITGASIPLCSTGVGTFSLNTSLCIGDTDLNVSVSTNAQNKERKLITDLRIDRRYSTHEMDYPQESYFNTTSNLWRTNISHRHSVAGNYLVTAECVYTSDSSLDQSLNETIQIANAPPIIYFSVVEIQGIEYPLVNNAVYEYDTTFWNWTGAVLDTDLLGFNVTFYNNTNGIVYQSLNNVNVTSIPLNTSFYFREFSNPYILSVSAWDLNSTTHANVTFNITDTSTPVCTGFTNTSQLNNTDYIWGVSCTDDSFFSMNITCDNGFTLFEGGLDVYTYAVTNSTRIIADTLCTYEYCDGHTKKDIDVNIKSPKKGKKEFDNKISIETDTYLDTFKTHYKRDRYSFEVHPMLKTNKISFTVKSDEHIYIMPQEHYLGWLISGEYWIDFENDDISHIEINRTSSKEVQVSIRFKKDVSTMEFNSIGKLNCGTGTQSITSTLTAPSAVEGLSRFSCDLSTTGQAIGLIGFAFMILIIIIFCFIIKIPFLSILIGFISTYFAWYIASCFLFANMLFIILGLTLIIHGIVLAMDTHSAM